MTRPDRRDFAEPGDLVTSRNALVGISSIHISDGSWSWKESDETNPPIGSFGIVVGTGSVELDLDLDPLYRDDRDDQDIVARHSGVPRYVLSPVSLGWFMHDEILVVMKLDG